MASTDPEGRRGIRPLEIAAWLGAALVLGAIWSQNRIRAALGVIDGTRAEMPGSCDLSSGPCVATFPDGLEVELQIEPKDTKSNQPVQWVVTTPDGAPPRGQLTGADMNMGQWPVVFEEQDGEWKGTVTLPFCTTQKMRWNADVFFDGRSAGFTFVSTK